VTRLSDATLATLPPAVARPDYDRRATQVGVVHIGIGAFHRAHQAVVFDKALASGDLRWAITGVSLRSPSVRDLLAPQDGLYTLAVRDGDAEAVQVVGAVRIVLVAPEEPGAVIAALASAEVHIVTLTITEKGYKLDPISGTLLKDDPDVAADLHDLSAPRTAAGYLVAGLAARHAAGIDPFTAISCDNLPHNGRLLREAVLATARAHDPALADWIAREGAFPQTMVDRIVPATTAEDVARLASRLGFTDQAMVKTEPYLQWVIEDRFCGPRPDFEQFGVQLTQDVAPWEEAKLRLLNGAHSGAAYLGGLAGIAFVHEFTALREGRAFINALWDESETTLFPPPGLDIAVYREALMRRFDNSALQHRTRQIAIDGSQKLPQRLLRPIVARLEQGRSIDALGCAVAAWMRWQNGRDDAGGGFTVDDPLAASIASRLEGARSIETRVDALLAIDSIFPAPLAGDAYFRRVLIEQSNALANHGVRAVLKRFAA
jgi:fructuronate reductase